jgi:2-oxo-4-hydroxy-4-carboxy-5-ureidoimidazoline decarboxylase
MAGKAMMTLGEINAMDVQAFATAFGDVAEHSPWVAKRAAAARPFASREAMVAAFDQVLAKATSDMQLLLIRAHPDLAGRAKLTSHSQSEQQGAGLDTLTAEEFAQFTELNNAYKSRFGFPFIFAVKGATKHQILESFAERINNSLEDEFTMALMQVSRIFHFRIEDRVDA